MKIFASNLTQTLLQWNRRMLALAAAVALVISVPAIMAQSGAGSIQGTVTDSTGAVIPNALIHVVNTATNVATDTKSNGVGFYQVPALFTGNYTVTVTAPGMKSYKTSIELLVAQNAVINPAMTTGSVTQQVEVAASAVQLTTTDNGTITSTLENQRISQLPLNDRLLTGLLQMTTPGYLGSSTGGTALNGLSGESMEFVADGVPMVNRQFGGTNTSNTLEPDPDSVQEVQAITDNGGAQYATPGTVVITTKSGTNHIHGSLFETARNNGLGIAKSRSNPSNYVAPEYIRNEFGMSGGGPIVLPHIYHGKDKSFWFLAYERYSLASGTDAVFTVLDQAMRNGDFSDLNTLSTHPTIYDPATTYNSGGAPCPGTTTSAPSQYCRSQFDYNGVPNAINPGRQSPLSKILNDIEPLPNTSISPYTGTNFNGPNPSFTVIPTWTFRLDHEFNETNRAYLRYTSNVNVNTGLRNYPGDEPGSLAADGLPAEASGGSYNPTANFGAGLGFTHVFSPTFFSETILSQQWESQHNFAGGTPTANYEGNILKTPNNFGEPGFPQIGPLPAAGSNNVGYGSYPLRWLDGTQFIYGLSQIITNLDENLTKTKGRHQMEFGLRIRHERFGYLFDEAGDTVNFTSQSTGLEDPSTGLSYGQTPNTGDYNADEFLGAANSYSVNSPTPYGHYHDYEYDGYFQDNYRMTRNLTWNIGLRYEAHPALSVANNLMVSFDYAHDAEVLSDTPAHHIAVGNTTQAIITNMENIGVKFETPQQAGFPSALIKSYNFNFLPRVGFAYLPFNGKWGTVIRGGYGRYIFPVPVRSVYKDDMATYPNRAGYSYSFSSASQSPDGLPNWLLRANSSAAGYPVAGQNTTNVVDSTSTTAILPGLSMTSITPDEAPDFATQTNFTIEQPLKGNAALRVSWVWAHGTNLDQEYMPNNHYSAIAWELKTGTKTPQGKTIGQPDYAATALGPYDNTVWGNNTLDQRSGWTNDNQLQVNYQRLFHHGIAYQVFYDWSKAFRLGGNYFRDGTIDTAQDYVTSGLGSYSLYPNETQGSAPILPPARPAGVPSYGYWHDFDRWADYFMDTSIPVQEVRFNFLLDMPFGRGKHYMSGANKIMDEVVGGWQLAADGTMASQDFYVGNGNWGPNNPIKIYKTGKKITDCRSGVCYPVYEWFNGYIAPSQISGSAASTCAAVVSGLPSGWKPYSSPLDTNYVPKANNGNCPGSADPYYNTNNVQVNLADGTTDNQGFAPGPTSTTPWRHTLLQGPKNFTADASVFKVFPIREDMRLRFNFDAFNVFNQQGLNNPNSTDGTISYTPQHNSTSHNTPRQIQLTLRLEF
jgi:hypothetical protein